MNEFAAALAQRINEALPATVGSKKLSTNIWNYAIASYIEIAVNRLHYMSIRVDIDAIHIDPEGSYVGGNIFKFDCIDPTWSPEQLIRDVVKYVVEYE
jgi:hypothetical protein